LIANGSVETSANGTSPDGWGQGGWGTNTAVFTYPAEASDGARGIKVEITNYTNGDAKWYFNEVPVTPGNTYTFSDYYKSNTTSYLTVQYHNTDGSYTYTDVATLAPSADLQSASASINVPTGVSALTVFHLIESVGWLTTDNYKLSLSSISNKFDQGMISFNFDDGWLSTYQNAAPILSSDGIKGTYYIITETLPGDWTGYVGATQVLALQMSGNEIGDHTRTHPDLTLLTTTQAQDEILGAKTDLLAVGIANVTTFAYPYGNYNDAIINLVKSDGFTGARTAYPDGENYKDTDPYQLLSVDVEVTTTVAEVESWVDQAIADRSWVILAFHQIDNSGDQYSVTPANLQQIVDYVKSKGIMTVTNTQGVQLISQ
jgi:peptidoglycan/xylan/chitin deacetylase (PgdA/CDA1 family)